MAGPGIRSHGQRCAVPRRGRGIGIGVRHSIIGLAHARQDEGRLLAPQQGSDRPTRRTTNSIVLRIPACRRRPAPGAASARAATRRAARRATGCVHADDRELRQCPRRAIVNGRAASSVFMICRRYTFSITPGAASRASAPRSRITSTLSGLRSAQRRRRAPATIAGEQRRVDERARPQHALPHLPRAVMAVRERILRRVADEAARVAHLVHHLVAAVDARGAADAFVLQALADVDAGRADLHADAAVDAVAEPAAFAVRLAAARAARLAARRVVGDDQRVAVEHHRLEARVRAHVLADLLAHPAGVAVGREAVEQHPERLPTPPSCHGDRADAKVADRREVADEREAGPQRDRDPGRVLRRLHAELCAPTAARASSAHARDAARPRSCARSTGRSRCRRSAGTRSRTTARPATAVNRNSDERGDRISSDREVDDVLRPEAPGRRCRTCARRGRTAPPGGRSTRATAGRRTRSA